MAFPFLIDTGMTRRIEVSGTIDINDAKARGSVRIYTMGETTNPLFYFELGNAHPGVGQVARASVGNQIAATQIAYSAGAKTATYSGFVDVRLYLEVVTGYEAGDDFDIGTYDQESEAGHGVIGVRAIEKKDPSGSYEASIVSTLGTFTVSGANSGLAMGDLYSYCRSTRDYKNDYVVYYDLFARGGNGDSLSADITCTVNGVLLSDYSYTDSDGSTVGGVTGSISADTTGSVMHMDASASGAWSGGAYVWIGGFTVELRHNTDYQYEAEVYDISQTLYSTTFDVVTTNNTAYPTGLDTAAGTYSIPVTKDIYAKIQGGLTFNGGTLGTLSIEQTYGGGGVLCGIEPSSMGTNDEMKDSLILTRLSSITKVGTLFSHPFVRLDNFDQVGNPTDVGKWRYATLVGGFVRGDSASTLKIEKVYNTDTSALENYRYMKLRVRSSLANQTVTMRRVPFAAGYSYDLERVYTFQTGLANTWTDITIDLLAPVSPLNEFGSPATFSTQDSRYPVMTTRLHNSTPSKMEPGWGWNYIYMLRFEFVNATGTYDFDTMDVFRANRPTVTGLISTIPHEALFDDHTVNARQFRIGLIADTDGRRSLELPVDGFPALGFWTDGFIANMIANQPGWQWTPETVTSSYFNVSYWGYFGDGVIINPATGAVVNWYIDEDVPDAGLDTPYQIACNYIFLPPDSGDQYIGGSDGPLSTLRGIKVLRGRFQGVVIDGSGTILSGVLVDSQELLTGDPSGSDTTDAEGRYTTTTPYALGTPTTPTRQHKVFTVSQNVNVLVGNRHTRRVCFSSAYDNSAGNPFCWYDWDGMYYRTDILSDDTVRLQRAQFNTPPFEMDSQPTTTTTCTHPRAFKDFTTKTLYVVYTRENPVGTIRVNTVYSNDDGETWSSPVAAFTGNAKYGTGNCSVNGEVVVAAFKPNAGTSGPGKIAVRLQRSGEVAFAAEFFVKNSVGSDITFADDTFHIFPVQDGGRGWILVAKMDGDSAPSEWYATDDLATWTKVL